MSKKKEAKTNAMRLLDALHIPYRHYSYECREFVDARHTAEALNLAEEKMYKTLVTEGDPRQYYVFVIPIGAELSLKKAARTVGEKALSMLPVKDITAVTGYVRGGCTALGMKRKYPTVIDASAEALPEMVVSGGRLGCQIELNPVDLCRAAEGFFAGCGGYFRFMMDILVPEMRREEGKKLFPEDFFLYSLLRFILRRHE